MKKTIIFVSLLLLTMVFITSCATSVSTQYMVPAKYDMSNYRNLAIISPIPYRFKAYDLPRPVVRDLSGTCPVRVYSGFNINSDRTLNEYITSSVLRSANDSIYFTITPPSISDTYRERLPLMAQDGIDAAMYIWTEDIDVEEYILAKEEKEIIESEIEGELPQEVTELVYYIEQKVNIQFAWEVKSTSTGVILARDSYRDTRSSTTKIDTEKDRDVYAPRIQSMMNSIASNFSSTIFSQIEPTLRTRYINLMSNKPKSRNVEEAYDIVKEGNLREAQEIFEKEWKRRDHIPSAYNAGLLLEALGERDDAIKLLENAYKESGNTKIRALLVAMRERGNLTKQAESQF